MHENLPSSATCRGCRYPLRELEAAVCPECGRAFDPGDPRTYIDDPRLHKRRRIVRWVAVILILGVLIFIFCPRGIRKGTITYNFSDGTSMTVKRWEPVPISWLPIRYPGFHRTTGSSSSLPFTIQVTATMARGGTVSGSTNATSLKLGLPPVVNRIAVTPHNGAEILKVLAARDNRGISIGFVLTDYEGNAVEGYLTEQYLKQESQEAPDERDN